MHQVIEWLTGFDDEKLQEMIDGKVTFETFFANAELNPNVHLITGVICGYRIEEIETPLTKQVRYFRQVGGRTGEKAGRWRRFLRQAKDRARKEPVILLCEAHGFKLPVIIRESLGLKPVKIKENGRSKAGKREVLGISCILRRISGGGELWSNGRGQSKLVYYEARSPFRTKRLHGKSGAVPLGSRSQGSLHHASLLVN